MLTLPLESKYYFYSQPIDMRKSFNGLYLLVMDSIIPSDISNQIFVFRNKRKNKIKIMHWENNGFVIWYKDLHKGKFKFPMGDQKFLEISFEILQKIINILF
jgi:transposase